MSFKTDYKDEIPLGGYPIYNIVGPDGTVIQSDVKIVRSNGNEQDGDAFGAKEVNDIFDMLNAVKNGGFFIKQEDDIVFIGDYEEWLSAGKPSFPAQ